LYLFVTETDTEYGYLFLTIGRVLPGGSLFFPVNYRIFSLCDRALADVFLCSSSSAICSVVWGETATSPPSITPLFCRWFTKIKAECNNFELFCVQGHLKSHWFVHCPGYSCMLIFLSKLFVWLEILFTALAFSLENNEEKYDYLRQKSVAFVNNNWNLVWMPSVLTSCL